MSQLDPKPGTRKDTYIRRKYLEDGRFPIGILLSMGLKSIVRDPLLLIVRYMPGPFGFKLRQIYYSRKLKHLGRGVLIDPGVEIPCPQNVILDDFSYIGRLAFLYAPEGFIKIGKRCHVSGTILGHGGVEIADYAASGGNLFSVTDSHDGGYRMSGPMIPDEQRNLKMGRIFIGKDAFIGKDVIIMPGVNVGEGAVIGPFSFVFRDVSPWTVVIGNPVRKIAFRDRVKFSDID